VPLLRSAPAGVETIDMSEKTSIAVLVEVSRIENVGALGVVLEETRKYFAAPRHTQPPIPDDVASFVPCRLLITELEAGHRKRVGRIQFLRFDGTSLYDREWTIDGEA
jgi:hypothetical protein